MHLVNLNVEGDKHVANVISFVDTNLPDILCLQEVPGLFVPELESRGYHVTYTPLTLRVRGQQATYDEGVLLATRAAHQATIHQYYDTGSELVPFDRTRYRETMRHAVIFAAIEGLCVATTHFTWTPEGAKPNSYQQEDIQNLMRILDDQPPHVLCGDLNIPRNHNRLYEEYLLPRYYDAVPQQYGSSLDRDYHRCTDDPDLQHLFTDFMVDHLLLPEMVKATDVSLVFGLSDHAAISADLSLVERHG